MDTVLREHTTQKDSKSYFRVPNYRTVTRPDVEYWFVADPSDDRLDALDLEAWPKEQQLSPEGAAKPREVQPLSIFDQEMDEINSQLRELSVDHLQRVELICSRLYTGPM